MKEKGWRYVIFPEDITLMVKMYDNGFSMSKISDTLGFSKETVKSIIKRETGKYTEYHPKYNNRIDISNNIKPKHKELDIDTQKAIISMYKNGNSVDSIARKFKSIDRFSIVHVLTQNNVPLRTTQISESSIISKEQINEFRNNCKIGDIYEIKNKIFPNFTVTERVVVLKIYDHFCLTDKGSFQYYDLITGIKINK